MEIIKNGLMGIYGVWAAFWCLVVIGVAAYGLYLLFRYNWKDVIPWVFVFWPFPCYLIFKWDINIMIIIQGSIIALFLLYKIATKKKGGENDNDNNNDNN